MGGVGDRVSLDLALWRYSPCGLLKSSRAYVVMAAVVVVLQRRLCQRVSGGMGAGGSSHGDDTQPPGI